MVVNKTTKKLKPLFPLPNSLVRKKPDNSCNTTARLQSNEGKVKFEDCSLKRNEILLTKLCNMVKSHKGDKTKNKEICDKTINYATKLDTELLIANSFKKFNCKKPKKKKKAILKMVKKKPEDKSTFRNTLVVPLSSMLVSSKKAIKDKLFDNKKNI